MGDLSATTNLLNAELPDPRFVDDRYLEWLYERNPWGRAYRADVDEGGVRVAHYALIPQEYRDADGPAPCVFSLNAVTRSGTQRKGYFTELGLDLYDRAAADGKRFVVGVANARSVGAVVKYMGWRLVGRLPVRLCLPRPRRVPAITHHRVDAGYLAGPEFAAVAADVDRAPTEHWTNRWTADHLRWRLARPHAEYVVHVGPDLVAVSTRVRRAGVPAAVLLKLLPRGVPTGRLSADPMVTAVCRHHRAPYAVYAGFNALVALRGVQPPRRLLPAPLNLIVRSLDPVIDQDLLTLDTYEFLDMDGY